MTTQITKTFGNLTITQTRIETPKEITKFNDVSRFMGDYYETLAPSDPDYTKAIIMLHNYKIQSL